MDIKKGINDFLETPFNRVLVVLLLLIGGSVLFYENFLVTDDHLYSPDMISNGTLSDHVIYFFHSPFCSHCKEQKPFNEQLMVEYPGVQFVYYDVTTPEGQDVYLQMMDEHGIKVERILTPTTFIEGQMYQGFTEQIGNDMRAHLDGCMIECSVKNDTIYEEPQLVQDIEVPFIGKIDLTSYSLPMLAIVLGAIDGFNPCAMWVLVYLIALVMGLKDRKKIWIIVGSFVLSSGILYFLFMTAWLNAFLFLGYIRIVTLIVGLVALGGGTLSLKEYWENRGKPLTCKASDDDGKEKTMGQIDKVINSPLTLATVGAIILLAFSVNSIEFVCSAAIPAIFTQVLALNNLSAIEYYSYILLYTFFFMLDDLIIFGLAAFAVTSGVGEKYASYCKIIGGAILFILGLLLLFAPNLLQ